MGKKKYRSATVPLLFLLLLARACPGGLSPEAIFPPPADASGYPTRSADLDALPGFQDPPPGYGQVPFWWWTGDPLDPDRLLWQIEQLHAKGVSGVQVNYAHDDTPSRTTYTSDPEVFSDQWWKTWEFVALQCGKRHMGIGLSGYTLDWPNGQSLLSRTIYSDPQIQGRELAVPIKAPAEKGAAVTLDLPPDTVAVRAYPIVEGSVTTPANVDLTGTIRQNRLNWTPTAGPYQVWVYTAPRKPGTLNPIHPLAGQRVIEKFFQPFEDHAPGKSSIGLNYFFQDELQFGVGDRIWANDLPAVFHQRKGYDLFEALPALFQDVGPQTVKYRLDFMDVKVQLEQERYFIPIFQWHWSRGLIYGCDPGSRGSDPTEFGDYFSAVRWYTAPGHDTPGGHADLIKGKVSSSIAQLYRRPRVWLEGYHSLGWGATPQRLMQATCKNYLYGITLLNLHGLYYTTQGSFWEWAPPSYHFRMPYWQHMGVFFNYFERLSYLMSQGVQHCDVAILYPVSPGQAQLGGKEATETAFAAGTTLFHNGCDFIFMDDDSLARADIRSGRLHVSDASYRVLVLPAMRALRWPTLQKALAFFRQGGIVIALGALPEASDRTGSNDPTLDAAVQEMFGAQSATQKNNASGIGLAILANVQSTQRTVPTGDVADRLLTHVRELVPRDVQSNQPIQATHRKIGPRDVYLVMGAPKNSSVEFRAKGRVELWDPWTGAARPLRVLSETPATTRVELPLESYEAQLVVFTPGQEHVNPPEPQQQQVQQIALDGEWEFQLQPTMDNRFGDFRLPVTQKIIGPEARIFRHAVETGDASTWPSPDFDDSSWQSVTYDFGPQFWLLGPLPPDQAGDALDTRLAKLTRVDPDEPVTVDAQTLHWRPYSFSWRQGLQGDPGHQGWHGLKENITDYFLCLGKRANAKNAYKYVPELPDGRYYLWTSATVDKPTTARIVASLERQGDKPYACEVLAPAAVFLDGAPLDDLQQPLSLHAGPNPLLIRYNNAGRGYFVLELGQTHAAPSQRTPLSMTWFDNPALIRFDVHAGAQSAEWFRFTAPPGLRTLTVTARGTVQAWADGQPMHASQPTRFDTAAPCTHPAVVALRVLPQTGCSGAAVFPEPVQLECGPGLTTLGDWSKIGALQCYSGGAWYRQTLTLTPQQARGQLTLDLGNVVATAEVHVNGQLAGIRVAPPWRLDISKQAKPGENRLEILVFNTLANHYLTIPTRYPGELTSGLLGPVMLEIAIDNNNQAK